MTVLLTQQDNRDVEASALRYLLGFLRSAFKLSLSLLKGEHLALSLLSVISCTLTKSLFIIRSDTFNNIIHWQR